jgi:hypothetical protein
MEVRTELADGRGKQLSPNPRHQPERQTALLSVSGLRSVVRTLMAIPSNDIFRDAAPGRFLAKR